MDEHIVILVIALIVLLYGYISNALTRLNISGPMVFTAFGVLLSPIGVNIAEFDIEINADFVTIIVEIALILVLFADAALLELKLLRKSWTIPVRLLFIGLPITIVAGTLAAKLIFPDEPFTSLLLLALLLTPTDAALGKAVVTDPKVPKKIRSFINIESGLNDGIIFPILLTVVALIVGGGSPENDYSWLGYVGEQIIFGALVGGAVGYVGAIAAIKVRARNWIASNYQNLVPIALAIFSFYLAESMAGNGFIAAFFAGLYAGNTCEKTREHIENFTESEGELLVLISFFMFGMVFVPATYPHITSDVMLYAFLSLTLLRIVPVMLCLIGTKFDMSTRAFIAWSGPRGVASILYVLMVSHKVGSIEGFETIFAVVTVTVLMSIVAHGVSAQPLANLYSRTHKDDS